MANKDKTRTKNVRFVSYTGQNPTLCCGILTVEIQGKTVKFGHAANTFNFTTGTYKDNNFDYFWYTNGCNKDKSPVRTAWMVNCKLLPKKYQKFCSELHTLINRNIPYGCCGGCVKTK